MLVLNFNWFYIKSALNFGIPLIPHSIGAIVISMIDRLFIAKMVSLNEAGLYMVGYQIGMIIGIIQDSFNKAWVPYFFEKLKQNNILMNLKIIKITYIYFIGILLFSIIFSLLVPKILNIIVGESYINASKYVFWISLGYAFDGMYKMVTNYIFFVRKNHILAWLTFVTAALNIILNYFLIKINGAVGAAQATAISFFVSFIITWFVSSKIYKCHGV
ncbi:hypothetical protein EXW96_22745 [Paenibacillus sp. JMULE4]|uniref:lipopolysaccharide biosynthesis protein n=1 Tax=Paenibacillus sp. JMULE4 TaxID=2518342 RepID=UPI002814C991|nr:polysaccharide biosynthesis C-terminal domain-containing protein [Paenibacillus sp. JMULE4]NTZ20259.1 hypothetical protein [Paenibacillus sp. JMULE4]